MRRIFVDFEWHTIDRSYRELRARCTFEIIEFGAVMLSDTDEEIGTFRKLVRPVYVLNYNDRIRDMTGIQWADLRNAPLFNEVLAEFTEWCRGDGSPYTVLSWSNSDLEQIRHEMDIKNTPVTEDLQTMLEGWTDFQRQFHDMMGLQRSISLEAALDMANLPLLGHAHDALDDARNTAYLYAYTKDGEKDKERKRIQEVLKPKPQTASLADLVDWSKLLGSIEE